MLCAEASAIFHVCQDQTRREFENQLIQLRARLSNTFRVFVVFGSRLSAQARRSNKGQ